MKTFKKSKLLLASSIVLALSGCDSDDFTPEAKVNNSAPTHGGDINITLEESVEEDRAIRLVDLLGTPQGATSGEGVAIDADANYLSVTDVVIQFTGPASEEVIFNGVYWTGNKITIRPQVFAPSIDTDQTQTIVATYNVFDGENKTARTATIAINGEDFAPEFENVVKRFTTSAQEGVVDLLEGVVDKDGEVLTISNFVSAPANESDAFNVEESTFTLDIPAFANELEFGDSYTFNYTYNVNDHNHSLPRNLEITVIAAELEPLPPVIVKTYVDTFNTIDAPRSIDLSSNEYTVERNADPIIVHFDTITPADGGPELKYSQSFDSSLVVDPIDFAMYLADGETKTFVYDFQLGDGDCEATCGHLVDTSFSVTVTKQANSLLTNGSFEDGITGWTVSDDTVVVSTASGTAWGGANELVLSGATNLSQEFTAHPGASYAMFYADMTAEWGRNRLDIVGGDINITQNFSNSTPVLNDYALYGHIFSVPLTASATDVTAKIVNPGSISKLDDVRAIRYSADNANDLIFMGAAKGDNARTFEDGTLAGWESDQTITITESPTEVISGGYSLKVEGVAKLNLPAGTIKSGKTYLLKADLKSLVFNQAWGNIVKFQIFDTNTGEPYFTATSDNARSISIPNDAIGETIQLLKILDTDKTSRIADWDSRSVSISFQSNGWGGAGTVVIDNVQLTEVE